MKIAVDQGKPQDGPQHTSLTLMVLVLAVWIVEMEVRAAHNESFRSGKRYLVFESQSCMIKVVIAVKKEQRQRRKKAKPLELWWKQGISAPNLTMRRLQEWTYSKRSKEPLVLAAGILRLKDLSM